MIDRLLYTIYFYEVKFKTMKKTIILLFLTLGTASLTKAQFINKLKEKAKTAANSSADRSADKVVDKTVNKTADNTTDNALNKADQKIGNLFKKKKKKTADTVPPAAPATDSVTVAPPNQNQ
jgi:hypothetical protein